MKFPQLALIALADDRGQQGRGRIEDRSPTRSARGSARAWAGNVEVADILAQRPRRQADRGARCRPQGHAARNAAILADEQGRRHQSRARSPRTTDVPSGLQYKVVKTGTGKTPS